MSAIENNPDANTQDLMSAQPQLESSVGRKTRPVLFFQLLLANLLVAGLVVAIAVVTFWQQTDAYFDTLMEDYNVSPGALNKMFTNDVTFDFLIGGSVAAVAGLVLAVILVRLIMRPLRRMSQSARAVALGDYSVRVPRASGELGDLAGDFNFMAERLEDEEQDRARLIRDLTHELRTPLTNVKGYIEGMEDGVFAPSKETFATLSGELERIRHLVDDLDASQMRRQGRMKDVALLDVKQLIDGQIEAHRHLMHKRSLTAQCVLKGAVKQAKLSKSDITTILANIVGNAAKYADENTQIHIQLEVRTNNLILEVRNGAKALKSENIGHLFDRFYRPDSARNAQSGGSGLGLSIVRRIVLELGGQVTAQKQGDDFVLSMILPV